MVKFALISALPLAMIVGTFALAAEPVAPATWPQWRGPSRDGRIAGAAVWPERLSDDSLQQT